LKPGGQFSRAELARALKLGEVLIAAALVVLAPVVRGETAYGAMQSVLPRALAGEAYFLIVLAFLGAMILIRALAAGRLVVPEPVSVALLGAYFLYVAVRAGFSDHPYAAQRETLAWLSNFLLFALFILVVARRGTVPIMLAAVGASLMVQSFQALYQCYWALPAMRRMLQSGAVGPGELDMQNPAAFSRVLSSEPFTTFLHANALGGWLASAALAAGGLFAGWLAVRRALRHRYRVAVVFSWIPVAVLFAWAFLLTGSKGAYVATFAAVAGLLLAAPPAAGRAGKVLRAVGAALVLLAVIGAVLFALVPELPGRAGISASLQVRFGYWRPAATMAAENPLFGVGPGKFGALYPQLKGPLAEESKSAHSAYMETAAEQGFVGLALLLAFWGWSFWRLVRGVRFDGCNREEEIARPDRAKLLAMGVIAGVFFTCIAAYWKLSATAWWALVILGALWAVGFALVGWPLACRDDFVARHGGRLRQWAIAAAVAAFLVHSSADMGMSLRSLVGPALILLALGLARPGRRELALEGRRAWPGVAAVAILTVGAALLAAREWRRGEAFALVQSASRGARPALRAGERDVLLKEREAVRDEIAGKLRDRAPGNGDRDELRRAAAAAQAAVDDMSRGDFPRVTIREKNLVVAGRMAAALEIDPHNWPLTVGYGFTCHLLANLSRADDERDMWLAEAERAFLEAVSLAPGRTRPTRDLARFYTYWSRRVRPEWRKRALEQYSRLAAMYPLNATYLLELGDAELLAGRSALAARTYRRALETSRRVGDEAIHLSILLENYNRLRWSRFMLEDLAARLDAELVKAPAAAELLYRRAMVEVARERFGAALDFMGRAVAADPRDAQLLLFAGYCHRLAGDHAKAIETFARAGRLEKNSAAAAGPGAVGRALAHTRRRRRMQLRSGEKAGAGKGKAESG